MIVPHILSGEGGQYMPIGMFRGMSPPLISLQAAQIRYKKLEWC